MTYHGTISKREMRQLHRNLDDIIVGIAERYDVAMPDSLSHYPEGRDLHKSKETHQENVMAKAEYIARQLEANGIDADRWEPFHGYLEEDGGKELEYSQTEELNHVTIRRGPRLPWQFEFPTTTVEYYPSRPEQLGAILYATGTGQMTFHSAAREFTNGRTSFHDRKLGEAFLPLMDPDGRPRSEATAEGMEEAGKYLLSRQDITPEDVIENAVTD